MRRIQIFALLSAAVVCVAMACGTGIQGGMDSADDLLYKKQYVEAERLYRKLLKRLESGSLSESDEATRLQILDRLGKINALYLHDYAQAIADYGQLVRHYPKSDQAFAARAMVADINQHKLNDSNAAIDELQKLVTEFPTRSETRWAQLQIVQAYFQLKNYEQARREAEALINAWPSSNEAAQARFQIANSYYVQGRYAEAIATYERLLDGNPDPSLASLVLFELGNCFQEVDEPERALAYYYACLTDHSNPQLVQRKIRRVRTRLHRSKPVPDIYIAEPHDNRSHTNGRIDTSKLDRPNRVLDEEPHVPVAPAPPKARAEKKQRAVEAPKVEAAPAPAPAPEPEPAPVPEPAAPAPEAPVTP
jgi:TolA-binding protein